MKKSHKKSPKHGKRKSILGLGHVVLKSPKGWADAQHLPPNSTDEHRLIHSLDLRESFWPYLLSVFSLNCINCHVFVSTKRFITLWCFGWLFGLLFLFSVLLNLSEWKHLIKILQHLYIYTEFCFLCQVSLMLGGLNALTLNTLALGRVAKASPFPGVFTKVQSQLVE